MKKILTILIILVVGLIFFMGCSSEDNKVIDSINENSLSEKQKEFKKFVINKLYAKNYNSSSIDTSQWERFTVDKYKFSFKYPNHLKINLIEENSNEEVSHIICIKKNEHPQTENCDLDFVLYHEEAKKMFFKNMINEPQFSPKSKEKSQYQVLNLKNNVLLYDDSFYQQTWFYNSKDNFILILAEPHFFTEVDDEEIVKGIIQSLEFY